MDEYSNYFVILYRNVLEKERKKFNVKEDTIRNAIKVMKEAYLPDPSWRSKSIHDLSSTNYDDPAFRCAYLHKYAMCYTGMVCHLLQLALDQSDEIYANFKRMKKVYLCSLGGGPGTDIVGVLAALASRNLDIDSWTASVIDLAGNWRTTFFLLLSELQNRDDCSSLRRISRKIYPFVNYFRANLLGNWNFDSEQSIRTADVVLMVKFISAAACNYYTERMIEKVFHYLKPGSMVLFIDNAAGGFDKIVKQKALDIGLTSIYGPLLHYDYKNSKFNIHRFGSRSQSKSKVVFEVYKKPSYSSFDYQSGYEYSKRTGIQSKINYVPESCQRTTQRYENVRQLNRSSQQSINNIRFHPCDVIIFFVFIFLLIVLIKLYK